MRNVQRRQYSECHVDSFSQCSKYISQQYRIPAEVAVVVNLAGLLKQVDLKPVVKTDELISTTFTNKHMLKTARVKIPEIQSFKMSESLNTEFKH